MADDDPPRPGPAAGFDEESKSRTGRFNIPHRGGARVEVGEPIRVGGPKPWMCAVKLVGQKRDDSTEPEPTQTLLVRTGRGATPEEAQREALANLTLVYGSPVAPPPVTTIELRESQRPFRAATRPPAAQAAPVADEPPPERPSILMKLKGVFGKK